ncbi:hypothetical protein B0H14DRAFT_3900927 [Mycena olivaceomarginata]|nr:hypothetical protein B0H14DRAFT_3900927 [Mycena olivaceomarginata]
MMDSDTESAPASDPSRWIGVGKIYRDVPAIVSTACTASRALPSSEKRRLPMADMPVTGFLTVQLASILDHDEPCLKRTSPWFSLQPPNCGEDAVWALKSIPPLQFILQLLADYPQAWLDGSASIVDHTDRTRHLPLWTVTFFHEVLKIKLAQDKWRESHYWLPNSEKFILDYVSWNTRHVGAPEGQLDWTRLISDEWLSGEIIDEMMRDIKARVSEDETLASSTIIRPLAFQFYITQLSRYGTQPKRYLADILAEVKSGKTRMLFPIHYNENHWMAFIINFENRTFGFGDSYIYTGNPKIFIGYLTQWLAHLFPGPFTNLGDILQHSVQTDYIHCGVYTANTIEKELFDIPKLKQQECGAARIQWFKKFMDRAGIDYPVDLAFPQIHEMDEVFADDLAVDVSAETYFIDRSSISINDILNLPISSTSTSETAPRLISYKRLPDSKIPKRKRAVPADQSSEDDIDSEIEKERARSKRTKEIKTRAKKTSWEERRQTLVDDPYTVKNSDGSLKGSEHEVYCRCTPSKLVKLEPKKLYTLANWYSHQKVCELITKVKPGAKPKPTTTPKPSYSTKGGIYNFFALKKTAGPPPVVEEPEVFAITAKKTDQRLDIGYFQGSAKPYSLHPAIDPLEEVECQGLHGHGYREYAYQMGDSSLGGISATAWLRFAPLLFPYKVWSRNGASEDTASEASDVETAEPMDEILPEKVVREASIGRDEGLKRGVRRALALARLPLDEFTKRIKKRLAYTPLVRSEHAAAVAKASLGTPAVMKIMSSKAKYGPAGETFVAIARQLSDKVTRKKDPTGKAIHGIRYDEAFSKYCTLMRSYGPRSGSQYNLMAGMTGAISQRQMRRRAAKSAVRLVSPDLCPENLQPALEFAKLMNYDGPWICAGDATKLRPLLTTSSEFSEKNSAHVVGSTFPLRNVLFRSSEEQSRIISEIEAEKAIATQTHVLAFKIPLPGMPVFPVQFRATKGKVKAEELRDIHLEFRSLCGKAGIKLLASSADGASSETKSQRLMMNARTPERLSYLNPKFGVFLSCPVYPDTGPHICTTDPDHARKTARNNFLYGTHFLTLGFVYLCHAILMFFLTVIKAPLLIKDLFNPDKQDDGAARRLFAPYIFSFLVDASGNLKHPSLEGLFILAFVFGELFDAWMKRDMPHIERVVCVFRARHFLTIWRSNIVKAQGRFPDLFQISSSFLATPSFHILMRLCDQFILLTLAHLEFYPNVPFMPWQHGTHFLEHFFGIARSFITDFSFGQFIEMYKHILIRQRILASGQYSTKTEKDSNNGYIFDFVDSRMKPEEIAALKNIPSRAEIDRACQMAWNEAAALATQFAKMRIPALPLSSEDLHPQFRTPNGDPQAEYVEEEEDEEAEVLESTPLGLDADALASETVRVPRTAPSPPVRDNDSIPGSSLSTPEAMAHAAHHVVTEQLLAEKAAEDEAELAALEERLENEPATKKTVSGRMRIEELLNPAPPVALKTRPIPTFLVAGQPISRQSLVDQRTRHGATTRVHSEADRKPETDGRYLDGKFSLNHAAHQLKEAVEQSESLRTETAFQKGRYRRWIASGDPKEWKVGCKIHVALGDIAVPHIKVRGVTKLTLLRVDHSLVIMRSAVRIYLGLVRGIYRYGSVSGKHESFTDAETVDGLSYLSLEVYEQCSFRRNFFQHVSPGETADDYDLALYTHAPISELVYHLNGASLSPLSQNTDGLFKLSAGDNGWDRWHVLSGREYRRVLELESDDDADSSEDEGDYEEPEESGRKRKPKAPRGAPKKNKKTATQKKPAVASKKAMAVASKKPTAVQKPTALQEARKAAVKSARAAGGAKKAKK